MTPAAAARDRHRRRARRRPRSAVLPHHRGRRHRGRRALVDEEQFGPAIPVIKYTDIDDAVRQANASEQGLGASVWSSDTDVAVEVAKRIQAGTVWINQHGALNPIVPFGGTKESGYGQEFGVAGLKAVAAPKVICR